MTEIFVSTLDKNHEPEKHPLPLEAPGTQCSIRLRCLPGASALHVVLSDDDGVRVRAEIQADGNEPVPVDVERDQEDRLHVTSPNRRVMILPVDARYEPARPILPAIAQGALDLALVIDGTTRFFFLKETAEARDATSRPLVQDAEQWPPVVEKLERFLTAMSEHQADYRLAVLAFGDQKMPHATAEDLHPRYRLYPQQEARRVLRPRALEDSISALRTLPATPGGDFVDAVADALDACAGLRWRPEARKLVVLFGDSPGHSVLHPVPQGGDAGVRDRDVDQEAMRLHELGVELVTLYYDPPADIGLREVDVRGRLLEHAHEQYRRLASLPSMAFDYSTFDPPEAAQMLRDQSEWIGRGAALGELLEVLPTPETELMDGIS